MPTNHLPDAAYAMPRDWSGVMTTAEWRETARATSGWIMACGEHWNLSAESIGGGIVRVRLELRR